MAFASSTFQRVLANEFFTNSSAETQPQTATDGNLIASLSFVRSAIQSLTGLYLPINNPTYTGTLSGERQLLQLQILQLKMGLYLVKILVLQLILKIIKLDLEL